MKFRSALLALLLTLIATLAGVDLARANNCYIEISEDGLTQQYCDDEEFATKTWAPNPDLADGQVHTCSTDYDAMCARFDAQESK